MQQEKFMLIIEQRREQLGLNKREICIKAGITVQYYDKLLKNDSYMSINILNSLAQSVGLELKLCFIVC